MMLMLKMYAELYTVLEQVQQSEMCCSCLHTHMTLDGLLDDVCCHNVVQFVVFAQLGHHVRLPYCRRAQHTPTDWLEQEKMH